MEVLPVLPMYVQFHDLPSLLKLLFTCCTNSRPNTHPAPVNNEMRQPGVRGWCAGSLDHFWKRRKASMMRCPGDVILHVPACSLRSSYAQSFPAENPPSADLVIEKRRMTAPLRSLASSCDFRCCGNCRDHSTHARHNW